MATIINTQGTPQTQPVQSSDNSPALWAIVAVVALIILFFLFYYGLPLMRSVVNMGRPQVNVPSKIDVNVNKGSGY